jgi:hypothetical protein
MTDHHNDVNTIAVINTVAVIIDVQDLLTDATRALLNRDWKQAENAIDLADKHLQGSVVPRITRRTQRAA